MRGRVPVGKDDWETPIELFNKLDAVFHFDIDAAASRDNALCREYYSLDGVNAFDAKPIGKSIFCNPPFSFKNDFLTLCREWFVADNTVVLLLPSSTSEAWFHRAVVLSKEICFFKGRVQFSGQKNNPGGTTLFIFDGSDSERVSFWDWKNDPFSERIIF